MKKRLLALGLVAAANANAGIIDFENGLDPQFSYSRVNHQYSAPSNSGYAQVRAHTGGRGSVYNPHATTPSTFFWNGPGTFDLNSFVIAGAWGSQTLTIEGLLNDVVQHSSLLAVSNLSANVFNPNWTGINAFRITTGNDFVQAPKLNGSGQHWALDNIIINESIAVSEPATLALLGLGIAGIGFSRKKKLA